VEPPTKAGQDPEHSAGLYLIDTRGRLRAYYDVPFLAPHVAAAIRTLLPT
jgi:cytochrome oxidase Cu insertion factor (SCO1/SenC/PrrC family)